MGFFDSMRNWFFGGTNDPTQDWIQQYNGGSRDLNKDRSNAFYGQLTGNTSMNPMNWFNSAQGMQGGQQQLMSQLGQSANRTGQDMFNEFAQFQPQMMGMAGNVADQAMRYNGQQIEDYANLQSRENLRNLENQMSGSGLLSTSNGAALAAMARGAQDPIMQAMTQLGNMRSGAFQNAYNPMAQMGYGSVIDRTNQLGNALGAYNQSMLGNANIGMGLGGFLADQSQQQILAPMIQQQKGLFPSLLDALTGGLGYGGGSYFG